MFAIFSTSHPISYGKWDVPPFSAQTEGFATEGSKAFLFFFVRGVARGKGGDIVQPPHHHLITLISKVARVGVGILRPSPHGAKFWE